MKIINIKWDTDGDKELLKYYQQKLILQKNLTLKNMKLMESLRKSNYWMIYLIGYQILTDIVILDLRLRDKGKVKYYDSKEDGTKGILDTCDELTMKIDKYLGN